MQSLREGEKTACAQGAQRVQRQKLESAGRVRRDGASVEETLQELHQMELTRVRNMKNSKTSNRTRIEEAAQNRLRRGVQMRMKMWSKEVDSLHKKQAKKEEKLALYEEVFNECFSAGVTSSPVS